MMVLALLLLWIIIGALVILDHTRKEIQQERELPFQWWKLVLAGFFWMVTATGVGIYLCIVGLGNLRKRFSRK